MAQSTNVETNEHTLILHGARILYLFNLSLDTEQVHGDKTTFEWRPISSHEHSVSFFARDGETWLGFWSG